MTPTPILPATDLTIAGAMEQIQRLNTVRLHLETKVEHLTEELDDIRRFAGIDEDPTPFHLWRARKTQEFSVTKAFCNFEEGCESCQ
jgi:hypothetical protein